MRTYANVSTTSSDSESRFDAVRCFLLTHAWEFRVVVTGQVYPSWYASDVQPVLSEVYYRQRNCQALVHFYYACCDRVLLLNLPLG